MKERKGVMGARKSTDREIAENNCRQREPFDAEVILGGCAMNYDEFFADALARLRQRAALSRLCRSGAHRRPFPARGLAFAAGADAMS